MINTANKLKTLTVHVYKSAGSWRWRLKSANGRIVADSAEAYVTKRGADRAAGVLSNALIVIAENTRKH